MKFKFSSNPFLLRCLSTRVVNYFHELPVNDEFETFENRALMRDAIYSSIRQIWPQCVQHPSITAPDVTIQLYEDSEQRQQWRIFHEAAYDQYVLSLLPVTHLSQIRAIDNQEFDIVEYSDLVHISHPGGRGRVAVVHTKSNPDVLYVFKGVDFGAFLADSAENCEHRKDDCYHEIKTITLLPPYTNIISPPTIFVTVKGIMDGQQSRVCGTLYPFMGHGTLDDQVQHATTAGKRLDLAEKALWCFQMASAISHTHRTAQT